MRNVKGFTVSALRYRWANLRAVLVWALALLGYAVSGVAMAGMAGGGESMPWNSGMDSFIGDLTGKTAFEFTVGALVVGGITLIWSRDHDWSALFQRIIWIVVIGALILGATQGISYLTGYGALI